MPFVQRDPDGAVIGLYACKQTGYAEEFLAEGAPEIVSLNQDDGDAVKAGLERQKQRETLLDMLLDSNKPLDQIRADVKAMESIAKIGQP